MKKIKILLVSVVLSAILFGCGQAYQDEINYCESHEWTAVNTEYYSGGSTYNDLYCPICKSKMYDVYETDWNIMQEDMKYEKERQ